MAKHTFEEILYDFQEINKAQGLHNGRWEDELNHEDSAYSYIQTMKRFADSYGIEYKSNLEDNFDPDIWEEEEYELFPYYAEDELGSDLMDAVVKKMLDEIFEYVKFDKDDKNIKAIIKGVPVELL